MNIEMSRPKVIEFHIEKYMLRSNMVNAAKAPGNFTLCLELGSRELMRLAGLNDKELEKEANELQTSKTNP